MLLRPFLAASLLASSALPVQAQLVTGFSATLSGHEEVPANTSVSNSGHADLSYNFITGELTCVLTTDITNATAAHVHSAFEGSNGPVLFPLSPIAAGWGGAAVLSPTELEDFLHSGFYVNVHSPGFPGGAIRGQVRAPRHFVSFAIGANEVPPSGSTGTAEATLELDLATFQLSYDVQVAGMNATTSHIHRGFPGSGGPIVISLTPASADSFVGTSPTLTADEVVDLLAGRLYLNVHSPSFPAGEIRDQVHVGGLNQSTNRMGAANGISLAMDVSAGPQASGDFYWVLGSLSGTSPGLPIDGLVIPLQLDSYFLLTLNAPNSAPLPVSQGFLSPGQSPALFEVGAGILTPLIGSTINHAFVAVDLGALSVNFASNPQAIAIE